MTSKSSSDNIRSHMAGTLEATIGEARRPSKETRREVDPLKANVLKIFKGVDIRTPGVQRIGFITYTISQDEEGMHSVAEIGALTVARIDRARGEGTTYTLFADLGENYSASVQERNGEISGRWDGPFSAETKYSEIVRVKGKMEKSL